MSLATFGLGGDADPQDNVTAAFAYRDLVRSQQLDLLCKPAIASRQVCACGCGRWWYRQRGTAGRPVRYATGECRARVKNERRRGTP